MDPNAADADWNDFGSGSDNDADPTNEIQDVSAGQGLFRDSSTNALGLDQNCAPGEVLERSDNGTSGDTTDDTWVCSGGTSQWADVTGGILYSDGNVGIGAALTNLLYPLTVQGEIAAG